MKKTIALVKEIEAQRYGEQQEMDFGEKSFDEWEV